MFLKIHPHAHACTHTLSLSCIFECMRRTEKENTSLSVCVCVCDAMCACVYSPVILCLSHTLPIPRDRQTHSDMGGGGRYPSCRYPSRGRTHIWFWVCTDHSTVSWPQKKQSFRICNAGTLYHVCVCECVCVCVCMLLQTPTPDPKIGEFSVFPLYLSDLGF